MREVGIPDRGKKDFSVFLLEDQLEVLVQAEAKVMELLFEDVEDEDQWVLEHFYYNI